MSRKSDLTQLWLEWVESELSKPRKEQCWIESELSRLDFHISQSRVSPKIWVEHNPGHQGHTQAFLKGARAEIVKYSDK